MTFPIKPVDTVRKPADMKPADLDGVEGRWLDVPRLQQKNDAEVQSNYWCGRTSAAMLANYYAKFAGKTDEYIGHAEGKTGHGSNLVKHNLRWLGGPHKDKAAGVNEGGLCWPAGIFYDLGLKVDSGELVKNLQGFEALGRQAAGPLQLLIGEGDGTGLLHQIGPCRGGQTRGLQHQRIGLA